MAPVASAPPQVGASIHRVRQHARLSVEGLGSTIRLRQATISRLHAGQPATSLQTLFELHAMPDPELVVRPRTKVTTADLEHIS